MSFLLDPPALVVCGAAANLLPDGRARSAAERVTVATFVGTSLSLYVNARWTRPLVRLFRAESGRDWMLNSGLTRFEHRRPGALVHGLAVAMFLAYPAWYRVGVRLTRRPRVAQANS